jgi:hypothetical protein
MSQPKNKRASRAVAAVVILGALLAGCSDIYLDRRETVSLGADNAVASNMVEEMVDPWPRYSNNTTLAFNGERMQRAVECYRKDKVTQPADLNPSTDSSAPAAPAAGGACEGQMSAGSAQPASGTSVGGTAAAAH